MEVDGLQRETGLVCRIQTMNLGRVLLHSCLLLVRMGRSNVRWPIQGGRKPTRSWLTSGLFISREGVMEV